MRNYLGLAVASAVAVTLGATAGEVLAQDEYTPEFTSDNKLVLPEDHVWREWPFIGTPITPNALNGGNAPFPEFHIVYIDPVSWEHFKRTGEFREGTVIAKELTFVGGQDRANPDGSTDEVSGTGYFMGEYSGFEISMKSKERYPDDPGNWAYYTFGHQPEPYEPTADKQPVENCNACHEATAELDMVFIQFYPVLRWANPN